MTVDKRIISAREDERQLELLISEHEGLILKVASQVSGRYITRADDEWSIALQGFVQAVENYRPGPGEFAGFACMVIRRRLVDYQRSQEKYRRETPHAPEDFTGAQEEGSQGAAGYEIAAKTAVRYENDIALEIDAISEVFAGYGFTFLDLGDCSPKSARTRKQCAAAAAYLLNHPVLTGEMRASGQLPLKLIEKNTRVPRKLLERHRRYIIAAVEIISGDYPLLAEYMQGVRKEMGR